MQYNRSSWGGEQASPPLPKPFTLVQHNCLGSWDVFLSLFGSFTQLAHPPSIVGLQDPPLYRGKLPSFNSFTVFSPPATGGCKPRVAFYVYNSFLTSVSLLPRFFGRGDVMALDLFTPDGFFNPSTTAFTIINSYSTKGRSNNTRSVPPDIIFPSSPLPTLTLGDLDIITRRPTPSGPLRRTRSPPRPLISIGPPTSASPSSTPRVCSLGSPCHSSGAPVSSTSPSPALSSRHTSQSGRTPFPLPGLTISRSFSALRPRCCVLLTQPPIGP